MFVSRIPSAVLIFALAMPLLAAERKSKPYDAAPLLAAQREAMAPLARLDGAWRGTATIFDPSGKTMRVLTQTERIGSFLDGTVKVIEGRGYEADGKVTFNALAIVSFDPAKGTYNFRSYALGHSGDYLFKPTSEGFVWEIPAGPMTMRYTTTIKDGIWSEVGERIEIGKSPVRFIELKLQRISDSDWPGFGAVAPK